MTRQKELDQEAWLNETILHIDSMPAGQGKGHLGKKFVFQVPTTVEIVIMIEGCDYWHPPHCKYFKKDKCQMGKDLTKEESTFQSERKW